MAHQPGGVLALQHARQLAHERPDDRHRRNRHARQEREEASPLMSALPDERRPRLGLRLLLRAGAAMLLITLLSAASVATAVLLEVKNDVDIFSREQIPIPNIEGALDGVSAGGPQTILVLGSDRRFADIKAK